MVGMWDAPHPFVWASTDGAYFGWMAAERPRSRECPRPDQRGRSAKFSASCLSTRCMWSRWSQTNSCRSSGAEIPPVMLSRHFWCLIPLGSHSKLNCCGWTDAGSARGRTNRCIGLVQANAAPYDLVHSVFQRADILSYLLFGWTFLQHRRARNVGPARRVLWRSGLLASASSAAFSCGGCGGADPQHCPIWRTRGDVHAD